MAQWTNVLRNNRIVNLTIIHGLYKKTGPIDLVEPGLTAGRQGGR